MGSYGHGLSSQWMQTVLVVAQSGSPARAAPLLGISTATAYRHIESIEQALGVEVFVKARSGWRLRPEMTVLLDIGRLMQNLLRRAEYELRQGGAAGPGSLRIALSEDLAQHYIVPRLAAFRAASGGIRPDLLVSSAFANLAGGEADVAIRPHRQPGDALVGRRVGRVLHAFYGERRYAPKRGRLPIGRLAELPVCGFSDALGGYTAAQWIERNVQPSVIVARFGSTGALARAVQEGIGIGLLPCYVGDALPGLRPLLSVEAGLPVDVWIVTARANVRRQMVRAFMNFFAAAFRRDEALLRGRLHIGREQ
jgi:DNA-binding transcriptional LysR family regulator